jgi:hypothetical protein
MSFPVAFQSAVFYFVACTPCAKVRHRHKARSQAKKEREEKAKLETEQPGLYRHPSPFNTNPHWQGEINMGPSLSQAKKSGSKNSSQRGLTSSGRDSDEPSVSEHTTAPGDSRLNFADSTTVIPESDGLSQDWNRQRGYQREDEELWGQWSGHKLMDAFSKARDSAGRLIESKLGLDKEVTDDERREFYFSPRNPPVNDYHPPVVSTKVPRREAHQWMLQPPPPAKVMEGKVPVGRAISSGSKSSGRTTAGEEMQLERLVHEKLAREWAKKQRNSPNPTESELIDSLFATRSEHSLSFTRSRSLSLDGVEESFDMSGASKRRSRVRPVASPPGQDSDDDDDSDQEAAMQAQLRALNSFTFPAPTSHAAQRPKLETIASADTSQNCSRTPSRLSSRRQKSTKIKALTNARSPVGDDSD